MWMTSAAGTDMCCTLHDTDSPQRSNASQPAQRCMLHPTTLIQLSSASYPHATTLIQLPHTHFSRSRVRALEVLSW